MQELENRKQLLITKERWREMGIENPTEEEVRYGRANIVSMMEREIRRLLVRLMGNN